MNEYCLNVDKYRERVKQNLFAFIDKLPADKPWRIMIEPLKKDRTLKQNKALFGLAYVELEQQSGNDKNDLHEFFCGEFFGWTTRSIFGMTKKVPARTTTTDYEGHHDVIPTEMFCQFYAFVQQRAAENGFHVSDPDPMWRISKTMQQGAVAQGGCV